MPAVLRHSSAPPNACRDDTIVSNTTTFGNITIHTIDHVLAFPGSLTETVALDNTSLALIAPLLRNVSAPLFNSSTNATALAALFDILDGSLHGFTLFAPNNTAITLALTGGLASLASNQTVLQAVFQNHVRPSPSCPTSPLVQPSE